MGTCALLLPENILSIHQLQYQSHFPNGSSDISEGLGEGESVGLLDVIPVKLGILPE